MDGYSETGAGNNPTNNDQTNNIDYSAFTITSLTTDVGGEASFSFKVAAGRITPRVYGFWVHEFENDSQVLTYRAVGTAPFLTAILPNPDRNYGRIGAGATMELQHGLEIYVDYEAIIGFDLLNSNQFSAGGRFEF
jgi:outer membrane autotransporter protein